MIPQVMSKKNYFWNKEWFCWKYSALWLNLVDHQAIQQPHIHVNKQSLRFGCVAYFNDDTVKVHRRANTPANATLSVRKWIDSVDKVLEMTNFLYRQRSFTSQTSCKSLLLCNSISSTLDISSSPFLIVSFQVSRFIVHADAPGLSNCRLDSRPTSRSDTPRHPSTAHAHYLADDLSRDKCCIQVLSERWQNAVIYFTTAYVHNYWNISSKRLTGSVVLLQKKKLLMIRIILIVKSCVF